MKPLLDILADGELHSGEAIGQQLGISRTAVWKQLAKLEGLGLGLESLHGKGYRIPGGLDLLDAQRLRQKLKRNDLIDALDIYLETDSTNQRASEAPCRPGRAYVCLAECQTAGRGRLGRSWVSPIADSIYLSLKWGFEGGVGALEGLSLAVGVVVARSLSAAGIAGVSLKWPNDIVIGKAKLGGVLIEITGDLSGPCETVIGIGINGALSRHEGARVDIPHTDIVSLIERPPDRNSLLAILIDALLDLLVGYPDQGFAALMDDWLALDSLAGETVTVRLGASSVSGVASGVDERGALLLATKTGLRAFSGGEVTLKGNG